ncbi:TatD family hydrolase [Candidatus Bandiella euplotis]|uniref:TatD family deoxyribonuclease n=1 Tax=Candidatus Bandiella euplotis TaxID=1664265 RepID=A0ABZ0ULQ1_9RICK|nr:TatD family hydrolase [Candidatus Bandiella woodruffii]WPX96181.1 TatD family deoxyribonuclease [Candidatus Bandiella woodruffii]
MLVDSHCHLDFKVLSDDIIAVLKRAEKNGVGVMQTICTKISEFDSIHEIAKERSNIFCSIGNHPLNLEEEGVVTASKILGYAKKAKVIGIGETGLDYYYSKELEGEQKKSFAEHIIAAQESGLPVIIHTREAEKDTLDILKHHMKQIPFTGVIHCFTASEKFALECVEMGFYISASGIVTFKNATEIQQAFMSVPIDRILIETDAPFLSPVPKRGKSNEPSHLIYTADFMAKLLRMKSEDFIEATTRNFFKLFSKAKIPVS